MEQNRLEFIQSIEEQKAQHQRHIDDVKVEAENRLSMVQSNLEMQLSNQKVRKWVLRKTGNWIIWMPPLYTDSCEQLGYGYLGNSQAHSILGKWLYNNVWQFVFTRNERLNL